MSLPLLSKEAARINKHWKFLIVTLSLQPHSVLPPATYKGGTRGQPFTCAVQGWVPISLMSNPHYCLSISCRHVKRTLRRSHSLKCFSHFCSPSFIYQVSLLARAWYLKIEGLCESLTVSVTGSHHLPLVKLLLKWSNRNLGNLMLQLSELFPKES